jgi:hypothetical protein
LLLPITRCFQAVPHVSRRLRFPRDAACVLFRWKLAPIAAWSAVVRGVDVLLFGCAVCQGRTFTDGQLYFRGRRCRLHQQTPHRPHEIFNYNHVPGTCVLHLGRHRHGARNITSGHRSNLILWCRSSVFRSTFNDRACMSWCGLHDETPVSDGGSGTHVPEAGAVRASAIPRVPAGGSAAGAPSVSL